LLASLQLEGSDYTQCIADIDKAGDDLDKATEYLKQRKYMDGLKSVADVFVQFSEAVQPTGCDIPQLASILEKTATQVGAQGTSNMIGKVEQILVEGSDVTLDLDQLASDANAKQWSSVGQDLGGLASWLQGTGCKSFVCRLVEGLLNGLKIPLENVVECEAEIKSAEDDFNDGADAFAKKQYEHALGHWASGLDQVAKGLQDCGVTNELSFIQQEAHVLGFGKVAIVGEVASILVHGSNVYDDVYQTYQGFAGHDYKSAGAALGKALNELSEWTKGHACQSDFCYVVVGMMQFLGDIQGDVKACSTDFEHAWHNFTAGARDILDTKHHHGLSILTHFNKDKKMVKRGVGEIGMGLKDVAKGVNDCHLQELATILEKLAVKLGIVPEIGVIEEMLHILIDGVHIEQEIGQACTDYAHGNWVGFGYNIAKLVKTLV